MHMRRGKYFFMMAFMLTTWTMLIAHQAVMARVTSAAIDSCAEYTEQMKYEHLKEIQQLINLIKNCNIRSIDDFFEHLPLALRKRYNLVYRTKGLGKASASWPRILLTGYESHLIISADSDPTSPMYGVLEIADYQQEKEDILFKTISFDPRGKKRASVSNNNPAKCMECHRNYHYGKNNFIWEDLPFWPGVYGSLVDKHFYTEKKSEPGWNLKYYLSEQPAYETYIAPKLEKEGLFKYLPKDIYDANDHYNFRTGLRPFWQMHAIQDDVNTDALVKHLDKKKWSQDQLKYYLLYTSFCIREEDYTLDKLLELIPNYVKPAVFRKMVERVQKKHRFVLDPELLNISYEKAVLTELWKFLSLKFTQHHERLKQDNCSLLNQLYKDLGSAEVVNCNQQFAASFEGHEDGVHWDDYAARQVSGVVPVYSLLYLGLNAAEFPFEHWGIRKSSITFNAYGTNRNSNMDWHNGLLRIMNFKETDPEMWSFFDKNYLVYPHYRPHSELKYFADRFAKFNEFWTNYCPNVIAPKSKQLTKIN